MTNEPKLSHLDKVFWPDKKITKGELIDYYSSVSEYILPHLKNRPISMNRYPDGIYGKHFYHKDYDGKQPSWLKSARVRSDQKNINYLLCQNTSSLLFLINLGCIDLNPWLSTIKKLESPSYCVIDLDPLDIEFSYVCRTACAAHEIMKRYGIKGYPKTSGATGLHIYLPLKPGYSYQDSKNFTYIIASLIYKEVPTFTSLERLSSKRPGKVYIDYLQNNHGQTLASVYSVRPVAAASVSCPLEWSELECVINPADYTMEVIKERLREKGDLFLPVLKEQNDISKILLKIKQQIAAG